jgi:hypothetical protein
VKENSVSDAVPPEPRPGPAVDDQLIVRPARLRIFIIALLMLLTVTLAAISTFGVPPTLRLSLSHLLGILILSPIAAGAAICLLGVFSPYPCFRISHEGIQRYSMFGIFGTSQLPWSEVNAIVVTQIPSQRLLEITTRRQTWCSSWRLLRCLYGDRGVPFIFTSNFAISWSLDRLLEQLEERFGQELDEYEVRLIAIEE